MSGTSVRDGKSLTSARFQVIENLLYHSLEIMEASDHQPPVDEIEWFFEYPVLLTVLTLEFDIGWKIFRWLDQAEVSAYHVCLGVLSCEFDGPDACPCADIKNIGWLSDGGEVELAA